MDLSIDDNDGMTVYRKFNFITPSPSPSLHSHTLLFMNHVVAKSGFEMCFAPSTFGAWCPTQNEPQIQLREV